MERLEQFGNTVGQAVSKHKNFIEVGTRIIALLGIVILSVIQIIHGNRSSLYVMIVLTIFSVVNWALLKQMFTGDENLSPVDLRKLLAWIFVTLTAIEIIQAFHSFNTGNHMGGVMAIFVAALFGNLFWRQMNTSFRRGLTQEQLLVGSKSKD